MLKRRAVVEHNQRHIPIENIERQQVANLVIELLVNSTVQDLRDATVLLSRIAFDQRDGRTRRFQKTQPRKLLDRASQLQKGASGEHITSRGSAGETTAGGTRVRRVETHTQHIPIEGIVNPDVAQTIADILKQTTVSELRKVTQFLVAVIANEDARVGKLMKSQQTVLRRQIPHLSEGTKADALALEQREGATPVEISGDAKALEQWFLDNQTGELGQN